MISTYAKPSKSLAQGRQGKVLSQEKPSEAERNQEAIRRDLLYGRRPISAAHLCWFWNALASRCLTPSIPLQACTDRLAALGHANLLWSQRPFGRTPWLQLWAQRSATSFMKAPPACASCDAGSKRLPKCYQPECVFRHPEPTSRIQEAASQKRPSCEPMRSGTCEADAYQQPARAESSGFSK